MHVPKGKPVHEHLKTSYVNVPALLADLQVTGFTGYLYLTFPSVRGYVFISNGEILNALDEGLDRVRRGVEAIDAILLRASSPDGVVYLYSHKESVIESISSRIEGEVVYKDLESDFTDLKKLMDKLLKQQETTFYVEVEFASGETGIIYTKDGKLESVLSLSSGEILESEEGFDKTLSMLSEKTATFHVYRCQTTIDKKNVVAFPDLANPPHYEQEEEEIDEREVEEIDSPTELYQNVGLAEDPNYQPLLQQTPPNQLEEGVETEHKKASFEEIAEDSVESTHSQHQDDYDTLLKLMGEVTKIVEVASTAVAKDNSFSTAFRTALLGVAERYPFFDPFAAEFEYIDGKIKLAVPTPPEELVNGLIIALRATIREIEEELEKRAVLVDLRKLLKEAFAKLQQARQEEISKYGLADLLATIVAVN
ncbi:MAG: hypothetical protein JNN15_11645 [Blastocatellia bacterium]|nr:hypothetical protein [Blastocatellia bacterium]